MNFTGNHLFAHNWPVHAGIYRDIYVQVLDNIQGVVQSFFENLISGYGTDSKQINSVILQTLHGPCLIGEMELVRKVASFTVQALEICRMLSIPLRYCRNYLLQDTYFLRKLCFDLIGKERTEALSLITAFSYPLENRMAKFILDNRQGDYFYIKKVHVAESLGVSYRHAGKIIHDFIEKGYLSKEKMVYTITDENALKYLAKELKAADIVGDL